MIASPGDVTAEREIVTEEIYRWNDANAFVRKLVLLPIKWETHSTPQMGEHPQAIINRQLLEEADILIGIFGTRIGTPTEQYVSGTVEEIKKHVAAGKTAKIYFSDMPVSPSSLDPVQYDSLRRFREECQKTGLYATFNSGEQFRDDFRQHISIELNQPRYMWLVAPEEAPESKAAQLSEDAMRLIRAAANSDGRVISQESIGFAGLSAGDQEFTDGTNRSAAKWRGIVKDLVGKGVLGQAGKGLYKLTDVGYEIADKAQSLEEASRPTEISLAAAGPVDRQYLEVKSNRVIRLDKLDFLTSADACISSQLVSGEGKEIKATFDYNCVRQLFNAPRPDRNHYDFSGPAKLRLVLHVGDRTEEVVLPVILEPQSVNNTQWVKLTGSRTVQLPAVIGQSA
jgi:hypothetical protein